MSSIFAELINARSAFSSHRNRRALFSRFDEIFSSAAAEIMAVEYDVTKEVLPGQNNFEFRKIRFENWKAFEAAELVFPATELNKPITLIGGNNGHGKTSILEGIVSCLYGVSSFLYGGRGRVGELSEVARRSEYYRFIERAMHRPAFDRGARMSAVVVQVATNDELLEVERRWYFNNENALYEGDEEVVVRVGEDREILAVPDQEEAIAFYEGFISSKLAPASMVPFLLFDGERIADLASRDMSEQVQFGIESALGVSSLRRLVSDLDDYIKDRSRDLQGDSVEAALRESISNIQVRRAAIADQVRMLDAEVEPLYMRRDEIVHKLGSLTGGSYQEHHKILEARHAAELQLTAVRAELATVSSKLLPFLLVGSGLMESTVSSLKRALSLGELTEQPLTEGRLIRLLDAFKKISPTLDPALETEVISRVREAWTLMNERLPGVDSAPHAYLQERHVGGVINALLLTSQDARKIVPDILERVAGLKKEISDYEQHLARGEQEAIPREVLAVELKELNERIELLAEARRAQDQELWKLDAELEPKNVELSRRLAQRRNTSAGLPVVDAASIVRKAIVVGIESSIPLHYHRLAEQVTNIYQRLAHKSVVKCIEISAEGRVSLYDAAGRNLRDTDSSAGESQIFAMSLIAAISGLLGEQLPMVVDTPLGRLDPEHRERILEFFQSRQAQTIILSQPEEVGGRYYEKITPSLAAEYHLSYNLDRGGLGYTLLKRGYFPQRAA
ncbi:AAA family ATPase [Pseudomonas aeruginosa]|uniref:AAA family ATPase n=1 Tax=Pseudomonas aeruginosa TaxID=287 RepID=UPI0010494046|nr:AAA family ATPase [Pseudomonas aeruginosa]HCE6897654.1 AAA family ATPase [Pseudomonas aeruginosa]HCE6904979.1 AAA family ATPase [Pseudomonas aeruginosa]HCE7021296.1 AAA family ATPase [Pseudomonas aeruginosa]HCE7063721.1 AAA family ATPase [Pseudomonas aeruginosa]HCE7346781.1 AAA family ATPase [Pseudomonas aeruginosa]